MIESLGFTHFFVFAINKLSEDDIRGGYIRSLEGEMGENIHSQGV
jgi:hypothetical protein